MKREKFNGFDENGNLPPGVHNMTLRDIEELFSMNKSKRRYGILNQYKKNI